MRYVEQINSDQKLEIIKFLTERFRSREQNVNNAYWLTFLIDSVVEGWINDLIYHDKEVAEKFLKKNKPTIQTNK